MDYYSAIKMYRLMLTTTWMKADTKSMYYTISFL